jgi:hypothetical protein
MEITLPYPILDLNMDEKIPGTLETEFKTYADGVTGSGVK